MFELLLFLMSVHRPYVDVGFSFKPFMAALMLTGAAEFFRSIEASRMKLRLAVPPFFVAVGVFVLVCMPSALTAHSASRVFTLIAALIMCLVMCVVLYRFAKHTPMERTLLLIYRAGIGVSVISIAGYVLEVAHVLPEMGFFFRGNPNLGRFSAAPRLVGLHLDANYFAADIALYLMVSLGAFLALKGGRKWRRAGFLCMLLCSICLVAASSRGAFLSVAVGGAVLVCLNWRRNLVFILRKWYWFLIAGLCLGLLVVVAVPHETRAFGTERLLTTTLQNEFKGGGRLTLWLAAWNMFKDHVLFGVGLGNSILNREYFKYGPVQFPHNTLVETLAETGLIGAAAYLWMLGSMLALSRKTCRRCNTAPQFALASGLLAANVSICVSSMFLGMLYEPAFWGIWGITAGVNARLRQGQELGVP